ncbi:hypothetical protein [Trinickia dinghuensis]|uniref:Uncharacterized protein n=1 Tax=Trinickia dinghuensis TaxID=2291023 RepID=A0A3D8JVX1_9BURK|nr:hypothetical protein [Trinickia dinghuensis]RDU96942.1 hypothetical protein DWV00_19980 [Trinickia dinghuensis]
MNFTATEVTAASPAVWKAIEGDSFAAAMAAADVERVLPIGSAEAEARARVSASGFGQSESALAALARQLDEVGRHRMEARTLSAGLAGAWATGVDAPTLAVSMHRQAHAMASYNLNVMWGAKLVGVTAGALRQLVSAT